MSRRLNSIGSAAEICLGEIHLQDFILGVVPLNLDGGYKFFQFTGDGLLVREIEVSGELLRNGGCALLFA